MNVISIAENLRAAARRLADVGIDEAAEDARILLAHAADIPREVMVTEPRRPLTADALVRFESLLARRLAREPVSRILGIRAFHALELEITPATLDPRPDSEVVVEVALSLAGRSGRPLVIADLGTGSGAIILALLGALPTARGIAVDISEEALAVAARNAARTGVAERLTLVSGRWLDNVPGPLDMVVSNPPYIRSADIATLEPEVRLFDPLLALDGGPDGLDAYRAIIAGAVNRLRPGGFVVLEVGYDQAEAVGRLCAAGGLRVIEGPQVAGFDLEGHKRCVAATTI